MKVVQMGRKLCGKRRNCSLQTISPFPTVFSKDLYHRQRKNQGLFGKGLREKLVHNENIHQVPFSDDTASNEREKKEN